MSFSPRFDKAFVLTSPRFDRSIEDVIADADRAAAAMRDRIDASGTLLGSAVAGALDEVFRPLMDAMVELQRAAGDLHRDHQTAVERLADVNRRNDTLSRKLARMEAGADE